MLHFALNFPSTPLSRSINRKLAAANISHFHGIVPVSKANSKIYFPLFVLIFDELNCNSLFFLAFVSGLSCLLLPTL